MDESEGLLKWFSISGSPPAHSDVIMGMYLDMAHKISVLMKPGNERTQAIRLLL